MLLFVYFLFLWRLNQLIYVGGDVKLRIVMLAGVTLVSVELRWRVCLEVICVYVHIKDNKSR